MTIIKDIKQGFEKYEMNCLYLMKFVDARNEWKMQIKTNNLINMIFF